MPVLIPIEEFLSLSRENIIFDVRTPAEFNSGHFPSSVNIPLFSDEERKIVGTIYKKQGRKEAIVKGLDLVGPKLSDFILQAEKLANGRSILMYCWRGGMRSSSMAWLFEMYGFKVKLLKGGYKSFRKKANELYLYPWKIKILAGRTGSGKTLVLQELAHSGEQVIDLEKMASHKGSSFGSLGEIPQPSQEQFENLLAYELLQKDRNISIWVEDESRMVGNKVIPAPFWEQMRRAPIVYIDIPFEERVKYLVEEYGKFSAEELKAAITRIEKRLGGLNTKLAIAAIDNGDLKQTCELSLAYYDKTYDHGLSKRELPEIIRLTFSSLDSINICRKIIETESPDGKY